MDKAATRSEEATEAVAAYLAASAASIASAQALADAWKRHFEMGADKPSPELIDEVAAALAANELALARANLATATQAAIEVSADTDGPHVTRSRRRRRRENKFLATLGRSGQRLLRAVLILLLLISGLLCTGAAISLALEIAGILHLIDDPTQLPIGLQLAVFTMGLVGVFTVKRLLRPVERALYGSKATPPKMHQL